MNKDATISATTPRIGARNEEPERLLQGAAFPVVGIGASAGGLEALRNLLHELPCETGMGFVIVQHLSPEHASSLADILSRVTLMPVCEVCDEPLVQANHVYCIPPACDMVISGGKLRLLPQERAARHRGIDQFFRSLAEDSGHLAIGIVLSGGASDGTLGIEEIKAAGGITFAQDSSAQQPSMPESAAESGCVDFVLAPEKIAAELARIARHPYVAGEGAEHAEHAGPEHARITQLIRRTTGVDFTHYRASTLHRRISRRMLLHKLSTLREYEEFVRRTPGESEALQGDVLISVTSFFRDPDAFGMLAEKVFPAVLADRSRHDPVRVWSVGCSTGEEAYSLAMVFAECAEAAGSAAQLQLFATDLNAAGVGKARAGLYPRSIAEDVSPQRLRRFFTEEQGGYRIAKALRERCIFSRHNIVADPPFSRVDLISCRNLLIYLEPVLQQQILPLFHYALKPGGHLWLGSSESVGSSRALFEVADAGHKIFVRKPGPPARRRLIDPRLTMVPAVSSSAAPAPREAPQAGLHRDAERLLLARYAPPGVIVTAAMDIVQFRGETGAYLAPAAGAASHQLMKMLREGLLLGVRAAIRRAGQEGGPVREEGLRVKSNEGFREVAVEVIPIKGDRGQEGGFVVLFDEKALPGKRRSHTSHASDGSDETHGTNGDEVTRLTAELAATREYLQSVIEEQEAANEELQSGNEEAQSANEELQSVNEELETSKEEIQSASEELATVNDELSNRNLELNRLNNDLTNIQLSTRLPMIILGRDLRIRRFTPAAEKTLGLAAGDVGRPLDETKLNALIAGLPPLLREVIDSAAPRERDVQDARGRWYSLRAQPYQTDDNRIDGVVVTLVDIDELRRARTFGDDLLAHAPVPILVLDGTLRVQTASHAFYESFQVTSEVTLGRYIYDLGNRQWDIAELRRLLEDVLPRAGRVEDFEVRHTFENLGPRVMRLNARRLAQAADAEPLMVLSIEDLTERQRTERSLAEQARLLDLTHDAIIVRDIGGHITYWNAGAEKLYGWPREEALGKMSHDLLQTESAVPFEQIHEALCREGHWMGEFTHTKRDGGRISVLVRKSVDRNSRGDPIAVLETLTDITERRRLEDALLARAEELAKADRSKDEFLAMLAHELRNPLAPLRNAAEILQTAEASAEEHMQAQRIIARQIDNMSNMIDDLLDISRITEGKIELRLRPIALEPILTAAANLVRSSCAARNQDLALRLPAEPVFLNADSTRLEQVLGNLLGNACKYSGDGSRISLSAERVQEVEPPEVIIRVKDDGHGIEPELLPRVFDLFVQATRALDRAHGGLGIGLTLVQRLIQLHGGSVEAHSQGRGHGAEFVVRLPILHCAPDVPSPPPSLPRETPRRILIVDDNIDAARTLAVLQTRRGHDTRTASTGPNALTVAAEFLPEVVLLDLGLPGMDGFEVARQIRSMPTLTGVLLVAMTGYGSLEDRARARAAGFDEHLLKPIDRARLQELLRLRVHTE